MSTQPHDPIGKEPSSTHKCECSRARELALDSRRPGGSAKNGQLKACPSLLRTESLRHLHCSRDTCHCMITATSITAELHLRHHDDLHDIDIDYRLKYCNCGTFAVVCTLNHPASVVAHNGHATTTSMQRFSQRDATVGSRPSSHRPLLRKLLDLHTWTSNTISMDCNWGISVVCKITWTTGNGLCATTGMSTTLTCTMTGMSRTSPRAEPEESRRSVAQFALWVFISAQEEPTTVDELNLGHSTAGNFAA